MKYVPRPGIVLTSICKTPVLIPTREAYEHCKRIQRIPLLWAILWETLCSDKPLTGVVKANMVLSKKSEAEVRAELDSICEALYKLGFMIEVQGDDDQVDA